MMLQLIDDVNKALDAECYYSALTLALTFPDICGKAEYPQENSTAKRYKDWYDEHIGKYEQCPWQIEVSERKTDFGVVMKTGKLTLKGEFGLKRRNELSATYGIALNKTETL